MLILILVPARVSNWSSLDASALWMEPLTTWYFRMFAKAVVSLCRPSRVDWGSLEKAAFVGAKMVNSPIQRIQKTPVIKYDDFTVQYILTCHKKVYLPDNSASASPACFTRAMRVVSPSFCRTSTRFPPNTLCTRTVKARKAIILLGYKSWF